MNIIILFGHKWRIYLFFLQTLHVICVFLQLKCKTKPHFNCKYLNLTDSVKELLFSASQCDWGVMKASTLLPSCGHFGTLQPFWGYVSLNVCLCVFIWHVAFFFKKLQSQHHKLWHLSKCATCRSVSWNNPLPDVSAGPPHPAPQVKFQSVPLLSGLHQTQQILTGGRSRSVQWILTFSSQLGRSTFCRPQRRVISRICVCVCEGVCVCLSPQAWKHEASAAAASGARAPPSGPRLRVCDRRRMGGRGGELEAVWTLTDPESK